MLDQNDIQTIKEIVSGLLNDQETRLTAKIEEQEARLTAKIEEQETRLTAKIEEQETRLTAKIEDARKGAVQDSARYMDVLYETKIVPQFKILAEGHETLLETLAPKSRVDALEEELAFLKTVVTSLNKEVAELKKAI